MFTPWADKCAIATGFFADPGSGSPPPCQVPPRGSQRHLASGAWLAKPGASSEAFGARPEMQAHLQTPATWPPGVTLIGHVRHTWPTHPPTLATPAAHRHLPDSADPRTPDASCRCFRTFHLRFRSFQDFMRELTQPPGSRPCIFEHRSNRLGRAKCDSRSQGF